LTWAGVAVAAPAPAHDAPTAECQVTFEQMAHLEERLQEHRKRSGSSQAGAGWQHLNCHTPMEAAATCPRAHTPVYLTHPRSPRVAHFSGVSNNGVVISAGPASVYARPCSIAPSKSSRSSGTFDYAASVGTGARPSTSQSVRHSCLSPGGMGRKGSSSTAQSAAPGSTGSRDGEGLRPQTAPAIPCLLPHALHGNSSVRSSQVFQAELMSSAREHVASLHSSARQHTSDSEQQPSGHAHSQSPRPREATAAPPSPHMLPNMHPTHHATYHYDSAASTTGSTGLMASQHPHSPWGSSREPEATATGYVRAHTSDAVSIPPAEVRTTASPAQGSALTSTPQPPRSSSPPPSAAPSNSRRKLRSPAPVSLTLSPHASSLSRHTGPGSWQGSLRASLSSFPDQSPRVTQHMRPQTSPACSVLSSSIEQQGLQEALELGAQRLSQAAAVSPGLMGVRAATAAAAKAAISPYMQQALAVKAARQQEQAVLQQQHSKKSAPPRGAASLVGSSGSAVVVQLPRQSGRPITQRKAPAFSAKFGKQMRFKHGGPVIAGWLNNGNPECELQVSAVPLS